MKITLAVLIAAVMLFAVPPRGPAAQERGDDRQTYGEAIGWYARQAEAGDPKAQFYYGLALEEGAQGRRDLDAALDWFIRAAEAGYPLAQYKLGLVRQFGETGGAIDMPAARRWYGRAAANGVAEAHYNLAVMLERGLGGPVDAPEAARLFEAAARSGIGEAMVQLGVLHARGGAGGAPGRDGDLEPDGIEALKWMLLAREAGVEAAEDYVGVIAGQLPPEARAEAQRRAEAWAKAAE